MKKMTKVLLMVLVVLVVAGGTYVGLNQWLKTPNFKTTQAKSIQQQAQKKIKKSVHLTAIGDSLTFGVGDATSSGGYVPLIKKEIELSDQTSLTTQNFGVSGDTSVQILKRIQKQKKVQAGLAAADLITMTVGANDLMHTIRNNISDIDLAKVNTASATYRKHLKQLLTAIRSENPKAPIVVASIYDPFYVFFPKLTALQQGMTKWNETTQSVLKTFDHTYYVDIDGVMTQPKGSVLATGKKNQTASNPFLYTTDHFHPNNRGYQAIANQLIKQIQSIKSTWLYEK
ncbi:lipase/acylhydrolase [Lapidilactobacillus concavus]|nr:lipase/acylhydrolase [Lapidilactobacillus concavus]